MGSHMHQMGLHVFRSHIHSSCMLRPSSATRSLIRDGSACHRQGSPSNHPITSAMRPPEACWVGKLLLLPSYGGCEMFVYEMYNKFI